MDKQHLNIHVLGCSGAIAKNCRTTSFLVDTQVLIDAGTGVGDLTLEQMLLINDIFITHSHLDHVAGLALMMDSVAIFRKTPVNVRALPETIKALKDHIFNGTIWPDFGGIPSHAAPVMRFVPLQLGQTIDLGAHQIQVLPAIHTVPAVAYAVKAANADAQWVFSGDTGPNPDFWRLVNELSTEVLVVETAFSEEERAIADLSLHLSPRLLAEQLLQLKPEHQQSLRVYLTHAKPSQAKQIEAELSSLAHEFGDLLPVLSRVQSLKAGQVITV